MKFRIILLIIFAALLPACNFTLAEDVTPPPNYVPPTPMPTLGNLFPEQTPNLTNGAAIYAEKCLACHGETGMGDGPQGIQLGVTVTAYGLPEIARAASPAQWYEVVTRGRMDRFMPPFASLNDQERWDVVAYIFTLHTTPEQIEQGKVLFEANCAGCSTDFFQDQEKMSALTEVELARLINQGNDQIPAFGANLKEDELWAVAAYLRSVSFDTSTETASASTSTPEPVTVTETPVPAEAGTPSVEGTPIEGTPQAEIPVEATVVSKPGFGTVSGTIDNQTGTALPSNLNVTLRGYEHGTDPSTGPEEVVTLEGTVNADGSYSFADVEIPVSRIFVAETNIDGMAAQSTFVVVAEGDTSVTVPPIVLFATTTDTSALVVDEVRLFVEYGDTDVQLYGVYAFRNTGNKTILVELKDGTEVPFIKYPEGMSALGYEGLQDSEPFVNTDNGFAIPPSENSYGLISVSTTTKADKIDVSQSFVLPVSVFTVFLPEGTQVEGSALTDQGLQAIQNFNFQVYTSGNLKAGDTVKFTVSGTPTTTSTDTTTSETVNPNRNLLIGAGAVGVALILAGVWMYLRDRKRTSDEDEDEVEVVDHEFESSEEVMDAIIALDDQHRAKKISDEAYQKRRAELKNILKGMM